MQRACFSYMYHAFKFQMCKNYFSYNSEGRTFFVIDFLLIVNYVADIDYIVCSDCVPLKLVTIKAVFYAVGCITVHIKQCNDVDIICSHTNQGHCWVSKSVTHLTSSTLRCITSNHRCNYSKLYHGSHTNQGHCWVSKSVTHLTSSTLRCITSNHRCTASCTKAAIQESRAPLGE